MTRDLIAGLDVGTSSVRSVVFDKQGRSVAVSSRTQRTRTPRPGWVEQDPEELFRLSVQTLRDTLRRRPGVRALGVTNQRESLVAVDARTGRALSPVVVWQDTRTEELARALGEGGWAERVWDQGGLPLTTYPSAPKMLWLLRHLPAVRRAASRERLLLGTVDTWILYRLMDGSRRSAPWVTDATNASRTLLYDLDLRAWSPSLLDHFQVDASALPQVRPSFGTVYGAVAPGLGLAEDLPLAADLGDQQASLLGISGAAPRSAKLTFGTGAFFLAEGAPPGTGRAQGLIRTVLYEDGRGDRKLGLEGGVGAAGSFLDWLGTPGLGLFPSVKALEMSARTARPEHGLTFLPALAGLFAPHWRPSARGALTGLTRATTRADLARAALEGVAHRVADILEAYRGARGGAPRVLWVDGGLGRSDLLLQMVADLSSVPLARSPVLEATSRGAALAAGLSVGLFGSLAELPKADARRARLFRPRMDARERARSREVWTRQLERSV